MENANLYRDPNTPAKFDPRTDEFFMPLDLVDLVDLAGGCAHAFVIDAG